MDRERPSRGDQRSYRRQLRTRAAEQRVLRVERRIVDDVSEQIAEHVAELRSRREAECDQVVPIDGEVGKAVRTQSLALEQLPKALEPCDVLVEPSTARSGLSEKVGLLVVDQVECE